MTGNCNRGYFTGCVVTSLCVDSLSCMNPENWLFCLVLINSVLLSLFFFFFSVWILYELFQTKEKAGHLLLLYRRVNFFTCLATAATLFSFQALRVRLLLWFVGGALPFVNFDRKHNTTSMNLIRSDIL